MAPPERRRSGTEPVGVPYPGDPGRVSPLSPPTVRIPTDSEVRGMPSPVPHAIQPGETLVIDPLIHGVYATAHRGPWCLYVTQVFGLWDASRTRDPLTVDVRGDELYKDERVCSRVIRVPVTCERAEQPIGRATVTPPDLRGTSGSVPLGYRRVPVFIGSGPVRRGGGI